MSDLRKWIGDVGFLAALVVYILLGTPLVPAHGDEYMHMAMARDAFSMARGEWTQLQVELPLQIDTEPYLRVLNGTLNKIMIGYWWMLMGRAEAALPGIYAWGMSQHWNVEQGNVPTNEELHFARWPSALLTALGVLPAFALGMLLRLRSAAYPLALLYALNPVILLNGRRAMTEGSLLFFSLLTMAWLAALVVAEHSAAPQKNWLRNIAPLLRYGVLGVLAGITIAAKHTGLIILAAVLGTLLATELINRRPRRAVWSAVFTGGIALAVWFSLNPGYWRSPLAVLGAVTQARAELLTQQTSDPALAYTNAGQRVAALVAQPFLLPPQYYEAPTWTAVITAEIVEYEDSTVGGWRWGSVVGGILAVLAGVALVLLVKDALRRDLLALMVLIWTAATVVGSLAIPLGWQRYYLPLTVVMTVLVAIGMARIVVRRTTQNAEPAAAPVI